MAAVFIRYLDARHQLVPMYRAIRDGRWAPAAPVVRPTEEIVQSVSRKNLAALDADFVLWFGYKTASPGGNPRQESVTRKD